MCSQCANAAVLSHEHLSVPCVRMEIQVAGISRVLAQQLPCCLAERESMKKSVCSGDSTRARVAVAAMRD